MPASPSDRQPVQPGTIPADELPLVIEDKTFVPAPTQLTTQDPTWDGARWGRLGALWYPHVYMPNQNESDNAGVNAKGRWDYLPWYWKGYERTENGPVAEPPVGVVAPRARENPGTPNPSVVPNAFFDTMLVNGTAYPYLQVERKAYRLRILNACGDRRSTCSSTTRAPTRRADRSRTAAPSCRPTRARSPCWPPCPPIDGGVAGALADGRARRAAYPTRAPPARP